MAAEESQIDRDRQYARNEKDETTFKLEYEAHQKFKKIFRRPEFVDEFLAVLDEDGKSWIPAEILEKTFFGIFSSWYTTNKARLKHVADDDIVREFISFLETLESGSELRKLYENRNRSLYKGGRKNKKRKCSRSRRWSKTKRRG